MKLPRFLGNIVRAGSSPEIVTTRNFDEIANVLEGYAQGIEGNAAGLDEIVAKVAKLIPPAILGKGAIYDVRAFGTLAKAITYIGANTATLYITNEQAVTANTTIPSNISILVLKGGSFAISSGVTLTINGSFQAGRYQIKSGSGTLVLAAGAGEETYPEWVGCRVNDTSFDNAPGLNEIFTMTAPVGTFASKPGVCRPSAGVYYIADTLDIPYRRFELAGAGPEVTVFEAKFTSFKPVMRGDSLGDGFINLHGFSIRGGPFLTGNASYGMEFANLNQGSKIWDVLIRNIVGIISVDAGYLCDIDIRATYTTFRASQAGITQAEWLTVWGPDRAPVFLNAMNVSNIKIRSYRVCSEETGGVTPFAVMIVKDSAGVNIDNTNIEWTLEDYDTFVESGTTYTARTQHGLVLDGVTGNVNGIDVETIRTTTGGIITVLNGSGALTINGVLDYQNYCQSYRCLIRSPFDPIINNWRGYDNRGGVPFRHFDSSFSLSQDAIVQGGMMIAGLRRKHTIANGGPNDDTDNVSDTYSFTGAEKGGIPDQDEVGNRSPNNFQKVIPKVLSGYVVTQGVDPVYTGITPALSVGAYIQITGGVMMRSDGRHVTCKKPTDAGRITGLQQVFRVRPWTASKWYRLFVGCLGQSYLVEYASAQTDPTGNWLYEFATDASLAITGLTANARLSYTGSYAFGNSVVMVTAATIPTTGYWNKDDVCWLTGSTTATASFKVCTTAGLGGAAVWTAIDDFTAKSLAAVNLNLSGVLQRGGTQILTAQQTGLGATLSAGTAGAAYTATEQAMLQALNAKVILLETKLKTHGLLAD